MTITAATTTTKTILFSIVAVCGKVLRVALQPVSMRECVMWASDCIKFYHRVQHEKYFIIYIYKRWLNLKCVMQNRRAAPNRSISQKCAESKRFGGLVEPRLAPYATPNQTKKTSDRSSCVGICLSAHSIWHAFKAFDSVSSIACCSWCKWCVCVPVLTVGIDVWCLPLGFGYRSRSVGVPSFRSVCLLSICESLACSLAVWVCLCAFDTLCVASAQQSSWRCK